jgi:hypothetical protein
VLNPSCKLLFWHVATNVLKENSAFLGNFDIYPPNCRVTRPRSFCKNQSKWLHFRSKYFLLHKVLVGLKLTAWHETGTRSKKRGGGSLASGAPCRNSRSCAPLSLSSRQRHTDVEQTVHFNVRFEIFTAVTMKNGVFWDIATKFVPHRRHYVSATESSRLMLCKIWVFHGGDYEERRLLGCDAVWDFFEQIFRRDVSPPSWGRKESAS